MICIAVAIEDAEDGTFVFNAVDDIGCQRDWSGLVAAPSADAAMLDVLVRIRSEVDTSRRIHFLIDLPSGSPLWRNHKEVQCAFPNCSIQRPSRGDAGFMARASAGLPDKPVVEAPPKDDVISLPALTVAADGSVRGRYTGFGWIASDGQFGLRGQIDSKAVIGKRPSMVAELRAIDDAVRKLSSRELTIFCDNSYAVSMARRWMNGDDVLPEGYTTERASGKPAGLVKAQRRIHLNRDRLDIRWERSHRGEPLNEGADALARLASRYVKGDSMLSPDQYHDRAEGLAKAFSAHFRKTTAERTNR